MKKINYLLIVIILLKVFLVGYFTVFSKKNLYETTINIVAHPNDDLLFLSPNLINDIEKNKRVVTIFLTSGDSGKNQNYWLSLEEGIKNSYAYLANKKNSWIKRNIFYKKNQITRFILKENNKIVLIFLRLPDGNYKGQGFKNNYYQSLEKLWLKKIKNIYSVDKLSLYSKESLISVLYYLINLYKPNVINTHNLVDNFNARNHSDHYVTAYFSYEAEKKYKQPHQFNLYIDKEIKSLPENIFGEKKIKKEKAFLIYAQYDKKALSIPYLKLIARQYIKTSISRNSFNINQKLSPLYTEGHLVRTIREGDIVILKGATTQLFGYHEYPLEIFWKRFQKLKENQINLIGAFINPLKTNQKIKNLDLLVKKTEESGVYLYLTPTIDGNIKNPINYVKEFPSFMESLAKRYRNKNHIMYGVWAEPHDISWSEYLKLVNRTITSVRKWNENAIIIINGIDWGSNFENLDDLISFKNIILSFHFYPASDRVELKRMLDKGINDDFFPWQEKIGKFPILIGESGGVWQKDFGSEEDIIFIQKILDNINKYRIHYTFYTIDIEGEISLFNSDNSLSNKGEIIIQDLINFSPYP